MSETWIVFKANNMNSPGWEERQLMPSGNLTDILWENWDYSGQLPQVGDRIRDYACIDTATQTDRLTHGRDGDWVVDRIEQFSSFESDRRIAICYCCYQPIAPEWQPLERGTALPDRLEMIEA